MYSSLRILLPPNARPELTSSRLAQIRAPPRWSRQPLQRVHRARAERQRVAGSNMHLIGRLRRGMRSARVCQVSRETAAAAATSPCSHSSDQAGVAAPPSRGPRARRTARRSSRRTSGVNCSSTATTAALPAASTGIAWKSSSAASAASTSPAAIAAAEALVGVAHPREVGRGQERHGGLGHRELVHRRDDGLRVAGGAGVERADRGGAARGRDHQARLRRAAATPRAPACGRRRATCARSPSRSCSPGVKVPSTIASRSRTYTVVAQQRPAERRAAGIGMQYIAHRGSRPGQVVVQWQVVVGNALGQPSATGLPGRGWLGPPGSGRVGGCSLSSWR